jgi:deoxyribodipyrimidine photo-lyase
MNIEKALVWFRRDLRDTDHAALSAALTEAKQVFCAFVFDTKILDELPSKCDRRVHFIHESLLELDAALRAKGGGLIVRHGWAEQEIPKLARELGVNAVFTNRDYEPAAKLRDSAVAENLSAGGIECHNLKDQTIFDGDEVLTQAGKPFTVFTPYKNAWLKRLTATDCATYLCKGNLAGAELAGVPDLAEIGFAASDLHEVGIQPGMSGARALWEEFSDGRIQRYGSLRDFPAVKGVSYLSVHLRFGTLSIRELVRFAWENEADVWLSELIWRDFYFMILDRFPQVGLGQSFKPDYDAIQWADWPEGFKAWCAGRTGYPLVDAAMRQLNHCGWMHNRLRMVVASFLTKDLGIDWRLGEKYFAEQLNDFDLSANTITQSEKFDPEGKFIRRYVPELTKVANKYIHAPWQMGRIEQEAIGVVIGRDYPGPIVDHAQARESTLARYSVVKKSS